MSKTGLRRHGRRALRRSPVRATAPFSDRRVQFSSLLPALDVLNAGWFVFVWMAFSRYRNSRGWYAGAVMTIAVSGFCVGLWVLVLGSEAVIAHGSYATMIMLYVGLAAMLLMVPKWAWIPIFLIHVIHSVVIWGLDTNPAGLVLWIPGNGPYAFDPAALIVAAAVYFGSSGFLFLRLRS